MKKILSLLFVLIVAITCSACFDDGPDSAEVQVVHGTQTQTCTFTYGRVVSVTPDYVAGKVLVGYYDTQDDSGKMYFDFLGKLKVAKWQVGYPDKIYAVYKELDFSKTYQSEILLNESPENPAYKMSGGFYSFNFYDFSEASMNEAKNKDKLSQGYEELAQIVRSNPNVKVRVTMNFSSKRICSCCNDLGLKYRVKIGSEEFDTKQEVMSSGWTTYQPSVQVFARQLLGKDNRINYISLQTNPDSQPHLARLYSVKNVYYTISIIG